MMDARLVSRRLIPALAVMIAVLVWVSVVGELYQEGLDGDRLRKVRAFVSVNDEANLPTWFSSMLLAGCAGLAWLIGTAERGSGKGGRWKHWYGLALIFLYLSLDEGGRLHERFIDPLRDLLGVSGVLQFTWIVVAIPVVIATAFAYAGFARDLPRVVRLRLIAAAAIYVVAAMGLEALSGTFRDGNNTDLTFALITSAEEGLEMSAALLALSALAVYAGSQLGGVKLRLEDSVVEHRGSSPERQPQQIER